MGGADTIEKEPIEAVLSCMKPASASVLRRAINNSNEIVRKCDAAIREFSSGRFDVSELCFVAVGSVGRLEALEASDLDLIPVASSNEALAEYQPYDLALREFISSTLKIKVSKGEDLTKCTSIDALSNRESIGGRDDGSPVLTKRILILTEARQAGGGFSIENVRRPILESYGNQDRTSGRHVLSLCNDIARYYRTLCIEYKWKADDKDADWSIRNMKLRYNRKVWYFSNIMSIVRVAETYPRGRDDYSSEKSDYISGLLSAFEKSPLERLSAAIVPAQPIELGRLVESFTVFLEYMSDQGMRDALGSVDHVDRYNIKSGNPFPALKFNSDILHQHIAGIVEASPSTTRQRILDWFLF